jgi:hypothetical protein
MGMGWVGKTTSGEKINSFFCKNALQIAIFMVVPPLWSSCNLAGGSGVRGKTDPNWVRKVFNCFRSL